MTRVLWALLALCLLNPAVIAAQEPEAAERPEDSSPNPLLKAILLPRLAQEAREAGIPEEDIQLVLQESQRHEIPAESTGELLEESTRAVREGGPVDNLGAFVQARLKQGLRGRELANAIHAEHAARGKKAEKKPEHAGNKGKKKGSEK